MDGVFFQDEDRVTFRIQNDLPKFLRDFVWKRHHLELLYDLLIQRRRVLTIAISAQLVTSTSSVIFQFADVCADIEERESKQQISQKLKKLVESIEKSRERSSSEKRKEDDLDDVKWSVPFGMKVLSTLIGRLKSENEIEWRRTLVAIKDSGLIKCVTKPESAELTSLIHDVSSLSPAVRVDAAK